LLSENFSKNIFKNIVDFSAFVLSKWINIWLYFYTVRIQTQYKIPDLRQNIKKIHNYKKCFVFMHTA